MNTSKELRLNILHDLKKISLAINQLVRDLDRIENDDSVGSSDIGSIPLGDFRQPTA